MTAPDSGAAGQRGSRAERPRPAAPPRARASRWYHETITCFYLRVIRGYVAEEEGERGARYGARDLPLRHYTKDLLMSAEARFGRAVSRRAGAAGA